MPYVYLLRSLKDHKQYIGSALDYTKRVKQHNAGSVRSTKNRRPLILIGYQFVEEIKDAVLLEKKYKRSHGALERAIKLGILKYCRVWMVPNAGAAQGALPGGV